MAIELTDHPRAIHLGIQTARRPEFYWDEMLSYEDKLLLYRSKMRLDVVPDEKIREFETEMALEGDAGVTAQVKAVTQQKLKELKQ